MSASPLTKARPASQLMVKSDTRPLAAGASVQQGSLAIALLGATSPGYYKQAATGDAGVCVGRFTSTVNNSAGSDGALLAQIDFFKDRWIFLLDNDTGTPVTVANREGPCFVLDDHSVTGAASQALAGIVYDVTSEGVWVETRAPIAQEQSVPAIQAGTTTLVSGTKTVSGVTLTATSRIFLTVKDPGSGAITGVGVLDAPVANRNTGAGTFTINMVDDSKAVITTAVPTVDFLIVG